MSDTLTVDDTRSPSVSQLWWSVLVFGLPFFLYLRTMAPTVYGLDSAELTTGAYVLGIVHAPGSPLYLLLGHLFTWLPIGDVGYRLNLLSGCAAALAILFVYLILHHLTGRHLLSLAGAWFLAFSYYFWISAVAAELYALHVCFVAGLIFLTVKWRESEHAWQLYLLAFLFGLGLGNHLSLILMAPGFAWLALLTRNRAWRHPRLLLIAAVCGIVGAAIYLYIPLRFVSDTPLNYARDYWQVNLASWNGSWWMVTGKLFESMFFAVPVAQVPHELRVYAHDLWSNFVGLGIMLGVIGLVAVFRRQPILHTGLLLMFADLLAVSAAGMAQGRRCRLGCDHDGCRGVVPGPRDSDAVRHPEGTRGMGARAAKRGSDRHGHLVVTDGRGATVHQARDLLCEATAACGGLGAVGNRTGCREFYLRKLRAGHR